ncbi:MAG TPA: hypothetical protein VMZ28_00905 [Kofleriaceae bacterium]|nr:hypothetical protein [Kofleriaceae bacterium]
MRSIPFLLALTMIAPACSEDDHGDDSDVVALDDASDEVAMTILDRADRGDAEEDADVAARLVAPTDGTTIAVGAPVHLDWEPAQSALRHGRTTGDFVVLRVTCDGVSDPLVVVGIESTDWTCDQEHWDAIVEGGGGPCGVEVVSAYVSDGVIEEGPFIPGDVPSFTVE